jgi:hypothetical protein
VTVNELRKALESLPPVLGDLPVLVCDRSDALVTCWDDVAFLDVGTAHDLRFSDGDKLRHIRCLGIGTMLPRRGDFDPVEGHQYGLMRTGA